MKLRELKELIDICSDDPVAMEQDVEIHCETIEFKGTIYKTDRDSTFKLKGNVSVIYGDKIAWKM